ncbi:MAG: class I SAM-dependent rRNA methyltransferase, partial [Hydrocarboniphaga effusa]|nr:class I SAM-dependent rRNA methyltransferase [Hydrocarboniphaga effusa]
MSLFELRLKPHEERRLRAGHLWVYSNEMDIARTPLTGLAAGSLCQIVDARGKPLGVGYVNPHTLLSARLLSSNANACINVEWLARRIATALALRERIYSQPYYRLAYGESDGLPGLVVDRYGEVLVVQIGTAGMELLKPLLSEALQQGLKPRGMFFNNDTPVRQQEGLTLAEESVGDVPDTVLIEEGGVKFEVPLKTGQKTGWFYDQRDNRERLSRYARGKTVLDVYSYIGGWALRDLKFGAVNRAAMELLAPEGILVSCSCSH